MNRSHRIPTVIAFLALFACLAGTATAAKLITGKGIKDNTVTGKDIKSKSLSASDLSAKAKASLAGKPGPAGATGAQGPSGPAGPGGPAGPAVAPKAILATEDGKNVAKDVNTVVLEKALPAGNYAITAKLTLFQLKADNGGCALLVGDDNVDAVSVIPANVNARTPMTLATVTSVAADTPVRISCSTADAAGTASDVKLVAIAVS